MQSPIVFKMIVLGQQGVGKSSMLIRYIQGKFSDQYNVTVGVEFASKNITVDGNKQVCLQIWDTAGQEAFRAIVRSFYKGISGVFLAFSLDNEQSLQALDVWHKEVRENGQQEVLFFLIGTKADLQHARQVTSQRAQQKLIELGALFFVQTSAKTGANIEQLFVNAAEIMYKKYMVNPVFREISNPNAHRRQRSFALSVGGPIGGVSMEKKERKCCN